MKNLRKVFRVMLVFALIVVSMAGYQSKSVSAAEFSDAVLINVNQSVSGSLNKGYGEEQNYYKFITTQAGSVTINFSNPLQDDSEEYWEVCLYNSEYDKLCSNFIYGNKTNTDCIATGIAAGTYYIEIKSVNYGNAKSTDIYTINANFIISDNWEKELNEGFLDASEIEVNSEYSGTSRNGYGEESDLYSFKLNADGYVTVSFSNPLQKNSEIYWNVYLYNSKYEELCSMPVYGNVTHTDLVTMGLEKGTYYIKVASENYGNAKSTDIYKIKANYTASDVWEKEFNNDFTSATKLLYDTTFYGTTCDGYGDEKDYYSFDIQSSGDYTVEFTTLLQNNEEDYWRVYLYDSAYNEITNMNISGNKTYNYIQKNLSVGTYYIMVESTTYSDAKTTSIYEIKVVGEDNNVLPSVTPSALPSVTPTPLPSVTPTPSPSITPSLKPTIAPSESSEPDYDDDDDGDDSDDSDDVSKSAQYITAKSYTKTYGSKSFSLNAETDGDGDLSYKSSNKKVATVSKSGNVSIKGYGETVVTITAGETEDYLKAVKKITVKVIPKTVVIKEVNSSRRKISCTWKKDKTVTGYQINLSGNGEKINSTVKKTSYKCVAKRGKEYSVKVRAYKTVGKKKYYGKWSKVKVVKVR